MVPAVRHTIVARKLRPRNQSQFSAQGTTGRRGSYRGIGSEVFFPVARAFIGACAKCRGVSRAAGRVLNSIHVSRRCYDYLVPVELSLWAAQTIGISGVFGAARAAVIVHRPVDKLMGTLFEESW